MKRKEIRVLNKAAEQENAFESFFMTQRRNFSDFEKILADVKEPRDARYTDYPIEELLYCVILKNVFNLNSMREMGEEFLSIEAVNKIRKMLGTEEAQRRIDREFLPTYAAINNCFEHLPLEELEKIRTQMVKRLLRKRTYEDARLMKKHWMVIVDATQYYSSKNEKYSEKCLTKKHIDKENGEEQITYYRNALEAKLYLGDDLIISLATEFIENEGEDWEEQRKKGAEKIKQDCEIKAFRRLSEKIKQSFPRLPICILGDSLYATETLFQICEDNNWEYLIRFKDGSIPSVAEEFHELKGREKENEIPDIKWVNDIDYEKRKVNVLEYQETPEKPRFQWITSIRITKSNAKKLVNGGRKRWTIENEGFNIQKNHRYHITHANSKNYHAIKVHYLLVQIADILLQLYENGSALVKKLEKTIKRISSDLKKSFREHQLAEDIFKRKKCIYRNIS